MSEARHNWLKDEILEIYNKPLMELLYEAATVHRKNHDPNTVQVSTLLSIKTGGCPEDCGYCPQAARYHTDIEGNDLMYFGGNTNTAEKRTRITTRTNTQKLERLFEEKGKVFIMPHHHPDTDAFGAAMGVLKLYFLFRSRSQFHKFHKNTRERNINISGTSC